MYKTMIIIYITTRLISSPKVFNIRQQKISSLKAYINKVQLYTIVQRNNMNGILKRKSYLLTKNSQTKKQ